MLIIGGGGAVGFSAIQLSVASGCHVTTTVGGESVERALAAGAEKVVDFITEVTISIFEVILDALNCVCVYNVRLFDIFFCRIVK